MSWKSYDWRKSGCQIQSDTIHPEEKRNNWGSRISPLIEKLEPYIKPYITKIDDAVGQLQRQISQAVQKAGGVVDDTFRLEPVAGETIETLGKDVVQESGEAAGKKILQEGSETVEIIQDSLDVKEEVQTVVADEVKTGIESGRKTISDLSNKAVRHPMNDHMPARYAKQLQYMSKEGAEQYLNYKTFFNSNWTDEQVRAALNFGYKEALNRGVITGKYSFKYLGENVTVYLEDGIFKTGYGDYVYTYDELVKLL